MLNFIIPHVPTPWAAHGGFGRRSYNPRGIQKAVCQMEIRRQYCAKPLEGAIRVQCKYYLPIPKSVSKKIRLEMLKGERHHVSKPDIDNLNKFLCDCLKGIVFEDDRQVVFLSSSKTYDENPRTLIAIDIIAPKPFPVFRI